MNPYNSRGESAADPPVTLHIYLLFILASIVAVLVPEPDMITSVPETPWPPSPTP
jgi:hypothetical protein